MLNKMFGNMSGDEKSMILVLAFINLFNYMDRQIVFPLFGSIKEEFALSDFQLGLLGTVFVMVLSLSTIPMGVLADKYVRKFIIFGGVMFWSVATFLSGLVTGFKQLLIARSFVGFGEASYLPAATSMMADNFSHEKRARVQGIFHIGAFLGGTLGTIIGGLIVYYTNNWRLAFFIVAVPGFLLAFLSLRLKDKRKLDHNDEHHIKDVLMNPTYVLVLISGTFGAFAGGTFISWGVEYINRYTHYNPRDASLILGLGMLVAGIVGITLGSYLADKWQEKTKGGRSLLVALSIIFSTPFLLLGFNADGTSLSFIIYFAIGIALFSFYLGPVSAVIHDITPSKLRATAYAVYVFTIHILGDTFSPAIVGKISDMYELRTGMIFATFVSLLSGVVFLFIAKRIHDEKTPLYLD